MGCCCLPLFTGTLPLAPFATGLWEVCSLRSQEHSSNRVCLGGAVCLSGIRAAKKGRDLSLPATPGNKLCSMPGCKAVIPVQVYIPSGLLRVEGINPQNRASPPGWKHTRPAPFPAPCSYFFPCHAPRTANLVRVSREVRFSGGPRLSPALPFFLESTPAASWRGLLWGKGRRGGSLWGVFLGGFSGGFRFLPLGQAGIGGTHALSHF